ncbi:MAG: hypothetical protein ABFS24_15165 [Pseudomonadota bacterium]
MLSINDLPESRELDRRAMADVTGGFALSDLGININVNINQEISQLQILEVNALNNIELIGADLGPINLDLNPELYAANAVDLGHPGNPFSD